MARMLEVPDYIHIKTTFGTFTFDLREVPDVMLLTALIFGYQSKLSNSAAKGKDASHANKLAAVEKMVEQLRAFVWNQKAGGGGAPLTTGEKVFREFLVERFVKVKIGKSKAEEEARNVDTRKAYYRDVCVAPDLRAKDIIRFNDEPTWLVDVVEKRWKKLMELAAEEADRRDAITADLPDGEVDDEDE